MDRPPTIALAGVGGVAQFYLPALSNRLRYWALIGRNRQLERPIESLHAEIDRLKVSRPRGGSTC